MTDNEIMDIGQQAEQAHPYIAALVEKSKGIIGEMILNLSPDQTLLFTIHRAQMQALDDVAGVVLADIAEGYKAIERAQNVDVTTQKGGIL